MNIHEYQGKNLLKEYNIPVPKSEVAFTVDEAVAVAEKLDLDQYVVKSQVYTGGRGKAGGIKFANSIDEVRDYADELIGKKLVTHQTGPAGEEIEAVLLEEPSEIEKEYYLSMVLDRATSRVVAIASSEGGMDIEEVSAKTPEKIHRVVIDPLTGLAPFQGRQLAFAIGLTGKDVNKFVKVVTNIYNLFVDKDSSMVEINPLVKTKAGDIVALDAKFSFDENGLYRQPDVAALRSKEEQESTEQQASDIGLSYIPLDGNIGNLVNGAGLAMATMDIIKYYGGEPANFLDVGGSATAEMVQQALEFILSDDNVEGIFVNIFGGIMRCDTIAEGVVAAVKEIDLDLPLVVRLDGTNVDQGRQILKESGLKLTNVSTLAEGAETIVSLVEGKGE